MKKNVYVILFTIACFASCKKIQQFTQVDEDVEYHTAVHVSAAAIDSSSAGIYLNFPVVSIPTDRDKNLSDNKTKADRLTSFLPEVADFQFISPDSSQTFNFLDTAQVYVSASGHPEVLISYAYTGPNTARLLHLSVVNSVDLKDYFLTDTMYYRIKWRVHALPPAGDIFLFSPTFNLLAKQL